MILGKEQGTNSVTIKDEPAVDQANGTDLPAAKYARMKNAFGCILNDNPDGAMAHLINLTADELRELTYYINWFFRLAESARGGRRRNH